MITRHLTCALVIAQLFASVLLQRDRGAPDVSPAERQFRVVYEWRTLDFAFRNEQERSAAIFRGEYVPRNVIISDVKPYANRLYVVSLRRLFALFTKMFDIFLSASSRRSHECCPARQPRSATSSHQTTMAERIPKLSLIRAGR